MKPDDIDIEELKGHIEMAKAECLAPRTCRHCEGIYKLERMAPRLARRVVADAKVERAARAALEEVKERKNQVCEGYELCRHVGCAASYAAFAIADAALAKLEAAK